MYQCEIEKSFSDFNKRADTIDGMQYYCRDCSAASATIWLKNNKFHYNEYQKQYQKERKANDINFKLAKNLRSRLRKALLHQLTSKNDTTEELLGISYSEFKNYIMNF